MRIFVTSDFQQQPNDVVIESLSNGVVYIDAADPTLYNDWLVDDANGDYLAAFTNQRMNDIVDMLKTRLDEAAKYLRYDNIASVRSYAGFPNAYQAEATTLAQYASDCWLVLETIEIDVKAGVRQVPTIDEVIAMFPPTPSILGTLFDPAPSVLP